MGLSWLQGGNEFKTEKRNNGRDIHSHGVYFPILTTLKFSGKKLGRRVSLNRHFFQFPLNSSIGVPVLMFVF